ncbi:helix-turn-helix transcriptional regulator [Catenulispora sp. NL8]|uniref:Helix-turn-helix transcriptional regulator n=1 Tax=Catenulispora pinistramenti TaxID=2705254 RepID=A0ABS5KXX1_9ACTN|nr:AraC family transcriptional regulator [Catenulispora pinistramenti]MBS2550800.1 helix-turn-helix transcriptional regulator [Catenulispora pinistramenti]
MDLTQLAIEQAIATMWNRYDEPLSLAEIADSAIMNEFCFPRVFRSMTGASPGRFLSAIRVFKAKHLLLQTRLSVTEIAYQVGYNSLGTFTSRFSRGVGAPPGRYRAKSQAGGHRVIDMAPLPPSGWTGEVMGSVVVPERGTATRTYVGLFSSPAIEGLPVSCDIVDGSGAYTLRGVPSGSWYVRAAAVRTQQVDPRPWARQPRFVGPGEKVTVGPDECAVKLDIDLRAATILDLPILLALPELDNFGPPTAGELVTIGGPGPAGVVP